MSSADLTALYREQVLRHAKSPKHFGKLTDETCCTDGNNPLCGDKLSVCIRLSDQQLEAIKFEGSGCAISMASASMMTDMLTGLSEHTASELIERVRVMLGSPLEQALPSDLHDAPVAALAAVRQYPSRIKCALLAWGAIDAALRGQQQVTTE